MNIHKYKYTITQLHKYTNTQIHKYKYTTNLAVNIILYSYKVPSLRVIPSEMGQFLTVRLKNQLFGP